MSIFRRNFVISLDFYNPSITTTRWDFALQKRLKNPIYLESFGYKSFSQSDEDGIIEEIFNRIGIKNYKFVEFGVENGLESNSYLLLVNGWSGLWIEAAEKMYYEILEKFAPLIANKQLHVINAYVNKENINGLFLNGGMGKNEEIDFLSIDIDGNDYYVWSEITGINARVVCIEYNAKIPPTCEWIQPDNVFQRWDGSDFFGASLLSITKLAERKGYKLVATNISGANAFFVRKDLWRRRIFPSPATAENLFNPPRYTLVCQKIGHPSKACIAGRNNQKKFYYLDNKVVQFVEGFYPPEIDSTGAEFSWTKSLESFLLVYVEKNAKTAIKVVSFSPELRFEAKLSNGIKLPQVIAEKNETMIILPVSNSESKWIPIKLYTSCLWSPGTEDKRQLGIAIYYRQFFLE